MRYLQAIAVTLAISNAGWAQQPPRPVGDRPAAQTKPADRARGFDAPAEAPDDARSAAPTPTAPGTPSGDSDRTYPLGTGDVIRISVFQQPDMATEARVSESGSITFPLLGPVEVSGLSPKQVESKLANLLKVRGFVRDPQINVTVIVFKSKQVSVLGHVNRPGRYALEEGIYLLTDVIALAGGVSADASDSVILVRKRNGKTVTLQVDLPQLFRSNGALSNPEVIGGDNIYVDRYPYFYIYGEVQRPGVFRLEKDMTLMQALSVGGGLTLRASRKDIQVNRRDRTGKVTTFTAQLNDLLLPDDVIYVKESLF
jgi:polysaccharide export outer membrane protein